MSLTATPALGGYDTRFGDTRLVEVAHLSLISLAIPQGGHVQVASVVQGALGLDLPEVGFFSGEGAGTSLARLAPDQALLIGAAIDMTSTPLGQAAYWTDQSDGWVALDLEGPGRFAAMERICPVDLAPHAFGPGQLARTSMEHLGAIVLRRDAGAFRLLSARSSAQSFLHAVTQSLKNTL